jgi:hypothetical protein
MGHVKKGEKNMRKPNNTQNLKQKRVDLSSTLGITGSAEAWDLFKAAMDVDLTPLIQELQLDQKLALSIQSQERKDKYQQFLTFRESIYKKTGVFLKERDLIAYALRLRTNKK